jgi:hypothetical protein
MGAFICGIISGYPIGAKSVCDIYARGKISKSEAESLLAYCNNSGPLFVIGAVGVGIYGSLTVGVALYMVHIFCAIMNHFTQKARAQRKTLPSLIIHMSRQEDFFHIYNGSRVIILEREILSQGSLSRH